MVLDYGRALEGKRGEVGAQERSEGEGEDERRGEESNQKGNGQNHLNIILLRTHKIQATPVKPRLS